MGSILKREVISANLSFSEDVPFLIKLSITPVNIGKAVSTDSELRT